MVKKKPLYDLYPVFWTSEIKPLFQEMGLKSLKGADHGISKPFRKSYPLEKSLH